MKRAFADPMATGPDPVYKQGIGAIYSPNTGENVTIFWKIEPSDKDGTGGGKDSKKKYCASLATMPVSVIMSDSAGRLPVCDYQAGRDGGVPFGPHEKPAGKLFCGGG